MATTQSSSPSDSPQDTRLRVALYARVSTLHNQNPEMQLAELREYASRRGSEVTAEYVDLGVNGSKESRPELNRMIAAAHARAFDAVVCWKLDRLGRVTGVHYAANSHGKPTFINFDKPSPGQDFTVMIWDDNPAVFGDLGR